MAHALIIKEDPGSRGELAASVIREGFSVSIASNLSETRQRLSQKSPDIILFDIALSSSEGIELFQFTSLLKNVELVLLTDPACSAARALHLSPANNLVKPIMLEQLQGILARVRKQAVQENENTENPLAKTDEHGCFMLLYGRSPAMQRVYEQIASVAQTSVTVFVMGESGTGKELVAQTIHRLSLRQGHSFTAVNCGAISPQLIESEMFGHEKGSFTGANALHRGFFERANGGTLFLDEVTEMSQELQVKFLRVLETGTFMRVGSSELHQTDARVIAATNMPVDQAVSSGKLREDLFYRLNVFPIRLTPLRERREDIPLLAEHFLAQMCAREKRTKYLSAKALEAMQNYQWPGNARELRNAVQRGFVMASGDEINNEWLECTNMSLDEKPAIRTDKPLLEEIERSVILATLKHFSGHRESAAAALGVSSKTLYNRLKKYAEDT